jgi:hypothetical protein
MSFDMRLFQRKGIYRVEIKRNKVRSLGTRDGREATAIFREMKEVLTMENYSMHNRTFNPLAAGSIPARPISKIKGFQSLPKKAFFHFSPNLAKLNRLCLPFAYLFIIIFLTVCLLNTPAQAERNFSFEVSSRWNVFADKDLKGGYGLEGRLNYQINDVKFFLFGSYDNSYLRIAGQEAGNLNIMGLGGGLSIDIFKHLTLGTEIGYFTPLSDLEKNQNHGGDVYELRWREWGKVYTFDTSRFTDSYDYKISGAFGGAVWVDLHTEIYKGLSLGVNFAYRFLDFEEYWKASSPSIGYIEFKEKRNMSGAVFGAVLEYRF